MKPIRYFRDQYGNSWHARTVKELREKIGGGRIEKMYRDTPRGTKHVGYIIGGHWCNEWSPVERDA